LVPEVIKNAMGQWFVGTAKQALAYYQKTGQYLGVFDNATHADAYGTRVHNVLAARDQRLHLAPVRMDVTINIKDARDPRHLARQIREELLRISRRGSAQLRGSAPGSNLGLH
jgi:hypothetical protein